MKGCEHAAVNELRIDKWLWAARFLKTRGAAIEAALGGRVHVNGERAKPTKVVRLGDTVPSRVPSTLFLSARSGGPVETGELPPGGARLRRRLAPIGTGKCAGRGFIPTG
jgi:hypothetical protein